MSHVRWTLIFFGEWFLFLILSFHQWWRLQIYVIWSDYRWKTSNILLIPNYIIRLCAYFLKSDYKEGFRSLFALFIRRLEIIKKCPIVNKKKYTNGINTNFCSGYIDKHIQNPWKIAPGKKVMLSRGIEAHGR